MVLKKSKPSDETLFIDASKEFVKVTNNNKLTEENISRIVSIFTERKDLQYVARLIPNQEIKDKEFNLSVSQYVERKDDRELIDIKALNAELEAIVARENELRQQIDKIISEIEG